MLSTASDADQLAEAELQEDGQWKVFTGNELATFFGGEGWIFGCWRKNQSRISDVNNYILATTVSSEILNSIAPFKKFILKKHYQILNGLEVG